MDESPSRLPLVLGLLACVALLAGLAREVHNQRMTYRRGGDPSAGWFSADPDGLYHARRLARLLDEGGPVAVSDPLFDHPHGARIPWPPYYTRVLQAALAPFAPGGSARDAWLERAVATLPMLFGVLTAVVVATAAWREGGFIAAGLAGATLALLGASLNYSVPGIGDHHAFATLLMALLFGLTARTFGGPGGVSPLGGVLRGLAAGCVAGLLVGSWVGGLVYVLIVQLALGWLVVVHGRRGERALVPFGLAFHAAYTAALAPAVLASPWKDEFPWMVVNLSWFHLAHAAAGFIVFLPLLLLRPGRRPARAYPWLVAGALLVVGAAVVTSDAGFAVGIREGFAWTGRANAFMAYITESQPLLVGQIGGLGAMTQQLGFTAWLLVPAWGWAAWRAIHGGRASLVVWVITVPPMLAQALLQRRFAEALGVPMAVVVAAAVAHLPGVRHRSAWAMAAVGLLLGTALQWPMVRAGALRAWHGERYVRSPLSEDLRSYRRMYEWLGAHAPAQGDTGVLATWDQGHAIEWVARRPTVANNFGSYIGEDSYLDPWRFFLEEDPAAAEARLAERRVRHVLVTGQFTKDLEVMLRLLRPDERREFLVFRRPTGPRTSARWYRTMAGRLLVTGRVLDPETARLTGDSLDFVRVVYVAPELLHVPVPIPYSGQNVPAGWIWERVRGATLLARGAPGERLEVHLDVTFPEANRKLLWTAGATAGADGVATLRVPYATDADNGEGIPDPRAQWTFGGRSGTAVIPTAAVLAGGTVELD